MSKCENLTERLQIRVPPQIMSDLDFEQGRLRMGSLMFGNRRPKHAAIVMTAIKAFMTMTPEQRDQHYKKFFPELDETVQNPEPVDPITKAVTKT